MWPFSYFWDSETHLHAFVLSVDLGGGAIDLILCLITLIMLRRELTEHGKRKVEWMVESGALIVAVLVIVTIVGIDRLSTLQERRIYEGIKEAPLTQQAQSVKAIVSLWTEGPNDINLPHDFNAFQAMSSKLAIGSPQLMKAGAPTMLSPIPRMPLHPAKFDGTNIQWRIFFTRDDDVFSELNPGVKVAEVINWGKFEIGVPFLPVGTKILKGEILLTVNDTSTNIPIESQTVRSPNDFHAFWDNLTNGVAIFNETNGYNWFSR